MALTITRTGDWQSVYGHWRKAHVTIDFDSSYLSGGESLTPADFGLRVIDMILIEPKNGYNFEYDYTNSIVSVYPSNSYGMIFTSGSTTSNVGTGEDTLTSTTLPANTLSQNGMGIRVTGWGTTVSTAGAAIRTVRGMFGTASTGYALLTGGAGNWKAVMEIVRTSATAQTTSFVISGASSLNTQVNIETIKTTSSTLGSSDLTTSKDVHFLGKTNGSIEDVRQLGMLVELYNPNAGAGAANIEVASGTDLSSLTGVRAIAWGV